jgi:predicted DNA-binding transcriptional regulator AlpA
MSKTFILQTLTTNAPFMLRLEFADGQCFTVDLAQVIDRHPSFSALKNPDVFATAEIADFGRTVIWNHDDNLELAADNLRARAIEQAGGYSHEFIWNWMAKNRLTLDEAARAIGISRRMLAYYRSGKSAVPRTVALACIGWEVGEKIAA